VRILLYDIETSPNIGYTWEKWEQNVIQFVKEKELLSFAYKWLGDKEVKAVSKEGQKDDKKLVAALHVLFQEADIIIAHNGNQFDNKVAKARMIYHGMKPPRILQSVDTKVAAKTYFKFNGNGLEDLGVFLKLGKKLKHPGFDMWLGCMANKKSSWKQMIKYNKQDVVLLEKVYLRMRPWIHNHPRTSSASKECPHNIFHVVEKRGYRATQTTIKQQMHCTECDVWYLTKVTK
jgi:hypothetical protein